VHWGFWPGIPRTRTKTKARGALVRRFHCQRLTGAFIMAFACGHSFADAVTWTLLSESSGVWATDPYFGALANDPHSIFSNTTDSADKSVDFIGFTHPGGSTETLNGGHLVYRWKLDFTAPVEINSITMAGFGDQTAASEMRLLNSQMNVLSTQQLTGYNSFNTNVLSGTTDIGTTFYYDEFDVSTDGRYRSFLGVNYTPVLPTPLPPALLLLASGLASVFFLGAIHRVPSPLTSRRSC
jgi:hypothetical protein